MELSKRGRRFSYGEITSRALQLMARTLGGAPGMAYSPIGLIPVALVATLLCAGRLEAQRFAVAGIDDDSAALSFLARLQSAVLKDDSVTIAGLVNCPLNVYGPHGNAPVETPTRLMALYRRVFGEQVRRAILLQNPDSPFVNWQGVMIGNGQVWYRPVCEQEPGGSCAILIYTINRDAPGVQ